MSSPPLAPAGPKRIAMFAPAARDLLDHAALIGALTKGGNPVRLFAPAWDAETAARVAILGAETATYVTELEGWALLPHRKLVAALRQDLAAWAPDTVAIRAPGHFELIIAAARQSGAGRLVANLSPGTHGARDEGDPASADKATAAFSRALEQATIVLLDNADDAEHLRRDGILRDQADAVVLPGTGVDLEADAVHELPSLTNGLVFAMRAPADKVYGVETFVSAAALVRDGAPNARFLLTLEPATGNEPIDGGELARLAGGHVELRDAAVVGDLGADLQGCHIFVHPAASGASPRHLRRALAAGRPVITTATPGCREAVDERVNGCLVSPGDVGALADAMRSYLRRPDLIPAMARASRAKAERRFDRSAILPKLLAIYGAA